MAIMRRDINFGFFIIVLACTIGFIAFTVSSNMKIGELHQETQDTKAKFEQVADDLNLHKSKLSDTEYELEVKVEREQDLSSKYTDLRGERDKLETDKNTLENELSKTKKSLAEKTAELTQSKLTLAQTEADLQTANTKVTNLQSSINSKNDEIEDLERERNTCQTALAQCQAT